MGTERKAQRRRSQLELLRDEAGGRCRASQSVQAQVLQFCSGCTPDPRTRGAAITDALLHGTLPSPSLPVVSLARGDMYFLSSHPALVQTLLILSVALNGKSLVLVREVIGPRFQESIA